MSFYDAYLDVLDKARQDAKYWNATVHGKELRLVKVSCGFFRAEIPVFERFRLRMLWLAEWSVFENFVVILIVCNALVMAHPVAYNEADQPRGVQNTYFVFEILVSAVFTVECLCRIIAQGLFFGDAPSPCYLKEPSNWIDMIVVICTLSEPFAAEVISEQDLRTMRVLRIFRVFRLVRSITFLPRLRSIVQALSSSLYRLWVSWLAIFFTLLAISMAGTDLWGDVYWRRCRMTEQPFQANGTLLWPIDHSQPRFCGGRYECVAAPDGSMTFCGSPVSTVTGPIPGYDAWAEIEQNPFADFGLTGYQTLWSGLLTTYQVVNIDGWISVMHRFADAKWPGLAIGWFALLMLFGGLVLMNLVLAILWHSFDITVQEDRSQHEGEYKLVMEAKQMDPKPVITKDIQVLPLHALVRSVQDLEVELAAAQAFHALDTEFRSMGIKNICYSMITSPWFGRVMNIIIIVNALCMCFDIYPPYDDTMLLILDNINLLCSVMFFAEVCVKIIGVGVSFFEDNGNRFDFLLVMLSVVELFMSGGSALSALRTARLLRIFRMIHMSMNLRILLMVFQMAVTPTLYFSMIVILFLYCSCLAGLQIFYKTDVAMNSPGLGFDSLGIGFLTSLAIFSGDGWLDIAKAQIQKQENSLFGFVYFLMTFTLGKAVLKNLLLGIIAAEFRIARDRMKQDFRLRMAIARAKLEKLRRAEAAAALPGGSNAEAEDDAPPVPESPRWPQNAFSRLEGTMEKTCARNMDVIKMIHVKAQAAKRLQELGKIHAMGKSKYAWPMGERHPPDPGMSDVEAMFHSSVEMQTDAVHRSAPPEASRPGLRLRREARHGAAPPEEEERCGEGFLSLRVAPAGSTWQSSAVEDCPPPRAERQPPPAQVGRSDRRFDCLPVWRAAPSAAREARLSFREQYRAARAAGRLEAEASTDTEACRRFPLFSLDGQHQMAPPEKKEVRVEEEPQIIGEQVPLSALEDLPREAEEKEESVELEKARFPAPPEKKSVRELLRACAVSIMKSPGFEPVVLFVIIISSISLSFESPFSDPESEVSYLQMVIDRFSIFVVLSEMTIRMTVMGLWKKPSECAPGELPGYFRVPWHVLDFVICMGGLTYLLAEFFTSNLQDLKTVRVLKMVSMLRPLRLIGKTSSVRLIIEALLAAIPTLINMTMVSALFFLGFALLFVGFFKGALYRCTLDPIGGEWINSQSHFDRVTDSLVTLMHIGSGEGWIDVTLNIISSQGIDLQPRPKSHVEHAIPVVIFMALTNFFLLNLLTGILVDSYTSTKADFKGQSADTSEERLIKKLQREVLLNPEFLIPPRRIGVKGKCFSATRQRLKYIIEHRVSRSFIFVGILSNAIVLAISPVLNPELVDFRRTLSGLLLGLFTIELGIKIFVYSTDFFKDKWHAYDSFAITGSLIGVLVNAFVAEKGVMTQILGGFQILRILMLVRYAWFMDSITSTVWVALPGLFQVCALLTLLMFMYACLGVGLFGTIQSAEAASAENGYPEVDTNFYSFGNAFLLLLRCATGERWHEIMYDIAEDKPGCTSNPQSYEELVRDGPRGCGSWLSFPYFISYIAIILFNMMNLIVAVVLDAYGQVHELIELEDFMVCMTALRETWLEVDRNFLGYVHISDLENMLLGIPQPVGFSGMKRKSILRQVMNLQVHEGSTLAYRDVVKLIAQRSVAFLSLMDTSHPSEVPLDKDALHTWNMAFPELPAEPPPDAILIAHIVIARKTAIYIRKKRWEWKQRSLHGQGALRSLRKAAASNTQGLPARPARRRQASPSGSPRGSNSPRSASPRSNSPRSGSPRSAASEGKPEEWEEGLYSVEVDIDTSLPGLWDQSLNSGPPTSIFVSQLAPEETTLAQRNLRLPQLSPLPWPPRELQRFQPEEQVTISNEESSMWAKVAGLAQHTSETKSGWRS
ncbi:unnamed protein product [Effrenium voratum]|nr:unnamed protein product [Effrenium voratum]